MNLAEAEDSKISFNPRSLHYCPRCKSKGKIEKEYSKGSMIIALILLSGGIVPGLIYMFFFCEKWKACSECGDKGLIDLSTYLKNEKVSPEEVKDQLLHTKDEFREPTNAEYWIAGTAIGILIMVVKFVWFDGQKDTKFSEQVNLYKKHLEVYEVFKTKVDRRFERLTTVGVHNDIDELVDLCNEYSLKTEQVESVDIMRTCHQVEIERCRLLTKGSATAKSVAEWNNTSQECHRSLMSVNDYETRLKAIEGQTRKMALEISQIWFKTLHDQIQSLTMAVKVNNAAEIKNNLDLISGVTCQSRPPLSKKFNELNVSMMNFCESFANYRKIALSFVGREKTIKNTRNANLKMKEAEGDMVRKLDSLASEMKKIKSQK